MPGTALTEEDSELDMQKILTSPTGKRPSLTAQMQTTPEKSIREYRDYNNTPEYTDGETPEHNNGTPEY